MIYKHLGQRRQVTGTESDAGYIRSSGQVEHRIECDPGPAPMRCNTMKNCVHVWAPAESDTRFGGGGIYPNLTKVIVPGSWQMPPQLAWIPLNQNTILYLTKMTTGPVNS